MRLAYLLIGLLLASPAWAQDGSEKTPKETRLTAEQLAAITARGRLLAEYDRACWLASDVAMAAKMKRGLVGSFLARKEEKGWRVVFGKLNEDSSAYLIAYECLQVGPEKYELRRHEASPLVDKGFFLGAIKAVVRAFESFKPAERRRHNYAVLPAPGNRLWVYIYPGSTRVGIWALGGDARFLMSGDGAKLIEKRRLHRGIIEIDYPAFARNNEGKLPVTGLHNHILSDVPEDSCVMHAIQRKPTLPEIIKVGENRGYVISPDGGIAVAPDLQAAIEALSEKTEKGEEKPKKKFY